MKGNNDTLYPWLSGLYTVLLYRINQYFVSPIRPHSSLPAFLAEGNARADKYLSNIFAHAKLSLAFYHPNVRAGAVGQFTWG